MVAARRRYRLCDNPTAWEALRAAISIYSWLCYSLNFASWKAQRGFRALEAGAEEGKRSGLASDCASIWTWTVGKLWRSAASDQHSQLVHVVSSATSSQRLAAG